jgi:hypothetical protein
VTNTICSICGSPYEDFASHYDICPGRIRKDKQYRQHLAETFHLKLGRPTDSAGQRSLAEAEARVRKVLERDIEYKPEGLLASETWWYIPHGWIGCMGFIVDKKTGYVNWLGSAGSMRLEHCIWGHDRGLFYDVVDFEFAPDTDRELAKSFLPIFMHTHPNAKGVFPKEPVWYRDSEIEAAFSKQFPVFARHFIWYAIPEIKKACETKGLRFTSTLSVPA